MRRLLPFLALLLLVLAGTGMPAFAAASVGCADDCAEDACCDEDESGCETRCCLARVAAPAGIAAGGGPGIVPASAALGSARAERPVTPQDARAARILHPPRG